MLKIILYSFFIFTTQIVKAQLHPTTFFTIEEAKEIKNNINKTSLLQQSYTEIVKEMDLYIGTNVDVPFPKDPAGGYTHDRHKSNYSLMFNSGLLYNITGNIKYATLVKNMFLKYAILNPTLKNHPQATSSSPGRLFWQALNDANWLVYTGMAYDLIYNSLTSSERKTIEDGAFKPEVDFFTKDLKPWFNLLHNHAVWACAGVGIVGIATGNKDYVEMAMLGTEKNGKSGFIAQMDNLFSPDGYYTEGPYYTRYAILPYMLFANALNNSNPSLKIFEHRNNILQKALLTCLQQTNLNGTFFPLNDALKEKDFTTNELVTAIDIARNVYGKNEGFLTVVQKQNKVLLNKGGLLLSNEIASTKNIARYYPYKSIESVDGVQGNEGGIAIIRNGTGNNLTSVVFKYASQGMGHGHFDRLSINLFDKGNEILQDYGSARFIGVEQKYGGRYLPENTKYAAQTIAHNTVVVDETSHFDGNAEIGQLNAPKKLFSDFKNNNSSVVVAKDDFAYKNVKLQRGIYVLQLPKMNKFIIDLFNINANEAHQYDLPFQYMGQFINTSFKYNAYKDKQEPLGLKNGYQFIWKEAQAKLRDTLAQFTFLNKNSFYTISTLIQDSATCFFTRLGANDPNFNLRSEPAMIIRKNGKDNFYLSVIEIHGNYDSVNEFASNAYSSIRSIKMLQNDLDYTIAQLNTKDKEIIIVQCNNEFNKTMQHRITISNKIENFIGSYAIFINGKILNN